jgi:putative methionine-R-sulfoxide reductase with GAF domain
MTGRGITLVVILALGMISMMPQGTKAEVIISESNEATGIDRDKLFFECNTVYCENNKKIRYYWVYDEIFKWHRKYKKMGRLSLYSKMSIITGAFRKIFNEKAILGFYVVRQLKDREVLEIGPFQSDELPPAIVEMGQGTIGRTWQLKQPIMVQDVATLQDKYHELHTLTKSEITYPIFDKPTNRLVAVFTLNSRFENHFEFMDQLGVKKVMEWMDTL